MKKLPKIGAIVSTESGEGTVEGIEVLNEVLKIKLKDEDDNYYYKKYSASDVKVIKDGKSDIVSNLSEEELKELEEMERMDELDKKNSSDEDI